MKSGVLNLCFAHIFFVVILEKEAEDDTEFDPT